MAKKDERMSEQEEETGTESESMSESESDSRAQQQKEQSKSGGVGLDYIMSLPDVPMNLPPHVELQRTRVFCNSDAPTHVFLILFTSIFNFLQYTFFVSASSSCFYCWVFFCVKFGTTMNYTTWVFLVE
jgi:hypothetical protein